MRDQDKIAASTHQKSSKLLREENQCYSDTPMVMKNYLQKQFAEIVSAELEGVIISLICGPRSKPIVEMAERLLNQLVELTGEKCTLQTPKNGTQDIMVFLADRVAVWLNEVVEESDGMMIDKWEKKLRGIEDGGKGDAGDDQEDADEDVEIIKKKKRPSALSRPSQVGDGDAAAKKGSPEQPSPTSSRPSKAKLNGDDAGKVGTKGLGSKKPSAKGVDGMSADEKGDKGGDKKFVASKPKVNPATREGSKQGGEGTTKQGGGGTTKQGGGETKVSTDPKGGSKPGTGQASGRASVTKSSSKPFEKKSMYKGPSRRPSTDGRGLSRTGTSKDLGNESQDGVKKGSPDIRKSPRPSQVQTQPSKTVSESRNNKLAEMFSTHLSQMIQDTEKKPTPRQEALQDVISKKLEDKVGPRDSSMTDAIREASALIASYIDKMAEDTEKEYGNKTPAKNVVPVAQRGKGPVFSVRKQPSNYFIEQITHAEAKTKVYKSRGLLAPDAISLSEGAFKPKEMKEWAKWANEVANMADRWSNWIDSTVSGAMKAADRKTNVASAPSTSSWRDWKDTAGAEALEWRRNKKLLDTQAKLFSFKAESSIKPKSAISPDEKNQPKKRSP